MGTVQSSIGTEERQIEQKRVHDILSEHCPKYFDVNAHLNTVYIPKPKNYRPPVGYEDEEGSGSDSDASINEIRENPLVTAILKESIWTVRRLLSGDNVKSLICQPDEAGRSPIWAAALVGFSEIIPALLYHKANVDQHGPRGWTPLHISIFHGHINSVSLLLDARADVKKMTRASSLHPGVGVLHILASSPKIYVTSLSNQKEQKRRRKARREAFEKEVATRGVREDILTNTILNQIKNEHQVSALLNTRKRSVDLMSSKAPVESRRSFSSVSVSMKSLKSVTRRFHGLVDPIKRGDVPEIGTKLEIEKRLKENREQRKSKIKMIKEQRQKELKHKRDRQATDIPGSLDFDRKASITDENWDPNISLSHVNIEDDENNTSDYDSETKAVNIGKKERFHNIFFKKRQFDKALQVTEKERELMRYKLQWKWHTQNLELILLDKILQREDLDLDQQDSDGRTALMYAAENRYFYFFSRLMYEECDFDVVKQSGWSALFYAIQSKDMEMVKFLIFAGANIQIVDEYFRTPIHIALAESSVKISSFLMECKANMRTQDCDGISPILLAMQRRDYELFQAVANSNPNFDTIDDRGYNLIIYAIRCNFFLTLVPLLNRLQREVKKEDLESLLRWKDPQGYTALHHAVITECEQTSGILVELDKYLGAKDCNGNTPLHEAALSGNYLILKLLIERCYLPEESDPQRSQYTSVEESMDQYVNNMGETILLCAAGGGNLDSVLYLLKIQDNGKSLCDPNAIDNLGRSILHLASRCGSLDLLNLILLNRNGDNKDFNFGTILVNVRDNENCTPLIHACKEGNWHIISSLMLAQAATDYVDTDGCTALHWACMEGELNCLRALLDYSANINASDGQGWTPVMHAVMGNYPECILELSERGAELTKCNFNNESCFKISQACKNPARMYSTLSDALHNQYANLGHVATDPITIEGSFLFTILSAQNLSMEGVINSELNLYCYIQFHSNNNTGTVNCISNCHVNSSNPTWENVFRFDIHQHLDPNAYISIHVIHAAPDENGSIMLPTVVDEANCPPIPSRPNKGSLNEIQENLCAIEDNAKKDKTIILLGQQTEEERKRKESVLLTNDPLARCWKNLSILHESYDELPFPHVPKHHAPIGFYVVPFRVLRKAIWSKDVISLNKRMRGTQDGNLRMDIEFRPKFWYKEQVKVAPRINTPRIDSSFFCTESMEKTVPDPKDPQFAHLFETNLSKFRKIPKGYVPPLGADKVDFNTCMQFYSKLSGLPAEERDEMCLRMSRYDEEAQQYLAGATVLN